MSDTRLQFTSLCYQSGLILLHRSSLKDDGPSGELARTQSRKSAGIITALLKTYEQNFGHVVTDFMVLHSAFSAALVHLTVLQNSDTTTYLSAVRALKSIITVVAAMSQQCGYAKVVYDNLRNFAIEHRIVPATSLSFWPVE
jgi:hypothetical protein